MSETDIAQFQRELANHPGAAGEKEDALQLGAFLRARPAAPVLTNGDFFNLQIQQRIAVAERPTLPAKRGWFQLFPGFAWAAAGLLVVGICAKWMLPIGAHPAQANGSPYFAQVVEAWPGDAGISASTVYDPRDNVTVLWLDGLDYIPASYQVK